MVSTAESPAAARDAAALVSRLTRSEALRIATAKSSLPWVRFCLGRLAVGVTTARALVLGAFALERRGLPWPGVFIVVSDGKRAAVVVLYPDGDGWGARSSESGKVPWDRYMGNPAGEPGNAAQGDVPWLGASGLPDEHAVARGLTYLRSLWPAPAPAASMRPLLAGSPG